MIKYLAKSGPYYVKAIDGAPCFRSTQDLSAAARFDTAEAARDFAPKVFRGSMLHALSIVQDKPETASESIRPMSRQDRFDDEPNLPWEGYMGS